MSDLLKPLFIVGSGGFAQEVAWVIDDVNNRQPEWHLLGFVEDISSGRSEHYGRPILESYAVAAKLCAEPFFACGMGAPLIREKESVRAENLGWKPATLIHPSVIEARFVSIGEGCVIGAGSVLAPYARIGRHCVVNVQSTIGHNAEIGDYSVVSPGARILGGALIGPRVLIGANASVYQRRRVGADATVGANSFLHTDLGAGQSALGVVARSFLPVKQETA